MIWEIWLVQFLEQIDWFNSLGCQTKLIDSLNSSWSKTFVLMWKFFLFNPVWTTIFAQLEVIKLSKFVFLLTRLIENFSSVLSTMPSIASDSEEPDLACTMTAIGNPSIRRVPVSFFYSSTSSSVVEWLCGGYLKLINISTS